MAAIDAELAVMRRDMGVGADAGAFHAAIARDPRWLATSGQDIARRLGEARSGIEERLGRNFGRLPASPGVIEPLPDALSTTALNGFYQPPTEKDRRGVYFYNTSGLDVTCWLWAGPLISHELLPGHHLQFASVFESYDLSPYRREFGFAGYIEGWGEYARRISEAAGAFDDDPMHLYASRLLDRRFALRSLEDTGAHASDWSWRRAEANLASDPLTRPGTSGQIALASAILRGAGLAYWRGLKEMNELRRQAERHLGQALDVRGFHNTLLGGGALPFSVLRMRLQNASFLPADSGSLAPG
jgi:uncharacterized protein (DUF885 family)